MWINKYTPNTIDDTIGNNEAISQLQNLINNKQFSIVITGRQGIGKTLIVRLVLEKLGYTYKIINPNEIKDCRLTKQNENDDFINYFTFNNSVSTKLLNNKPTAVIFDETENITLPNEKKYIIKIIKYNNKKKLFPLIFISNNQHSKLLNNLKKICSEITFNLPEQNEIKKLVDKICIEENMIFQTKNNIDKLIDFAQRDIRRTINILEELFFHSNDGLITDDKFNDFINGSRQKNIDIGLYQSAYMLLNHNNDYNDTIKLYETEKVLLPSMIQENYIKKVTNKNKKPFREIISYLTNIADSVSIGDNIETSIYTDQNWHLQDIHGFYTCINTSYWINRSNNNPISIEDIKFSQDLNKTSLKNINRKNISNLLKIIGDKSIDDVLMINKFANHFINYKQKIIIDKLLSYNKNISIKDIELCLKIDKTTDFSVLNTYEKKNINSQLK